MGWLDWLIVLTLNLTVVGYGIYLSRGTHSSGDWFLGGRALPWWAIGVSMFATNMDGADLVGVTGQTYNEGIHLISVYAAGSVAGGALAAFWVVPAMYRLGFYTNAEYVEARFGATVRVLSALIQLQYRSVMLGMMIWSIYLLLTRMVDLAPAVAWTIVVSTVVLSAVYTAWGGLKSVVWTDSLQGVIIMLGAVVIFYCVWQAVGGWTGLQESLKAAGVVDDVRLADMTHIGKYRGKDGQTSPWVIMVAWAIIGTGYWTVNHTQTMRLMGARSLWDMKMAAIVGVAMSMPVAIGCAFLGVMARALPEIQLQAGESADTVYLKLANEYLAPGLKGLVVAAAVAAMVSTFDSMGSALSAIFTRDLYARMIVRDGKDEHYVRVGRFATLGVLCLGFVYLPFIFLQENMLRLLTTLVSVLVTPLLTVYIAGVFTPAHRKSGVIGLLAGATYGVLALAHRSLESVDWLPAWLVDRWMAYPVSVSVTATAMALATWILGADDGQRISKFREIGWLERSREALPEIQEKPFAGPIPWYARPGLLMALLMFLCLWIQLVLLW